MLSAITSAVGYVRFKSSSRDPVDFAGLSPAEPSADTHGQIRRRAVWLEREINWAQGRLTVLEVDIFDSNICVPVLAERIVNRTSGHIHQLAAQLVCLGEDYGRPASRRGSRHG